MKLSMASSPHNHSQKSVRSLMITVICACIPGILTQAYFFGFGVLIQLVIALVTASAVEAAILKLRNKPILPALNDGSAWLTAVLLAISIPPLAPWWITVIGIIFAIAMVKQLYGGLGFNIFNPAMGAYVLLLIAFPVQMTSWMPAEQLLTTAIPLSDQLALIFTQMNGTGLTLDDVRVNADGVTMATPLDAIKTAVSQNYTVSEAMLGMQFSDYAGIGWQWVNVAYLLGGIYLIKTKVINWHIPVSLIATLAICSAIGYIVSPGTQAGSAFHLFSGATMLGAFFIATDPVSACTTDKGRLIFGAAIGLLIYLIRHFGGYPDAVAFAVLLMNMAVPLIEHYTQPRTYGHGAKK
ncbi:electron transport complex protein RnfD [Pseudoalteromonas citrea]|uniref:Ion-translocating oxidoreductase complex subunit D n=2 Tax=Pseudoalteromonas citrea TaxID=43655 RepID=A0AAD4AM57_9GAMM|nr:electron transport complex subunit RsxD [Pseudoalteromonas citrea]KAF7775180.1 electron transport complex protein RnfD [Pseudoalteromonas citrea]